MSLLHHLRLELMAHPPPLGKASRYPLHIVEKFGASVFYLDRGSEEGGLHGQTKCVGNQVGHGQALPC